ncbi:MAG: glycosyltransferase [Candidatus Levyibacteriota bacterium]
MKVALVHDYIKEYGGAERVLEALHEIWPEAPIFTSVYLPEFLGPHRERFNGWKIKTSILQSLPLKAKLISPFRIIAPLIFRSFDFSDYDVVIVSATGAYTPNMIQLKTTTQSSKITDHTPCAIRHAPVHVCYCHTPPRYLYGFATARDWKKNIIFRVLGEIANAFLRQIDFKSAQNVDYFIANSKNVAGRIKKFYKRDSTVIYPPVVGAEVGHTNFFVPQLSHEESQGVHQRIGARQDANRKNLISSPRQYFLAGGRLARPKHIDLIVQACAELNLPLKIFGKGFAGYDQQLKNQKSKIKNITQKSKVEFLGEVSDQEKLELMKNAKAYIFASEDEDFGITPVEAMSVGTPVVAYRSGGVVESVVDGKTGIFFDKLSIESLAEAIRRLSSLGDLSENCRNQAKKFSKERFKKEIVEFIKSKI